MNSDATSVIAFEGEAYNRHVILVIGLSIQLEHALHVMDASISVQMRQGAKLLLVVKAVMRELSSSQQTALAR